MSDCRKCADLEWCNEHEECGLFKPKTQTRADCIRFMTDEELDRFLSDIQWDVANFCGGVTEKQNYPVPEQRGAWLEWLKQETNNGN